MKILVGNILESKAQTLVNTVNCVGVMGKGIALEFKKRFPEMFEDYLARCGRNEVRPGTPYLHRTLFPPQIVNFPTKSHWRAASKIEDVENGLRILTTSVSAWGITSLAIPPLGCGNGQLLWTSVGPLIYQYLKNLGIPVEMYAPYGTPPSQLTVEFLEKTPASGRTASGRTILQLLKPAWVALIEILFRIQREKYHLPVGRTIFQKIAFVATEEGLPTGLSFARNSYGPYCQDLDDVKKRLADAGLLQENRLGRMFEMSPGLAYQRSREKYADQLAQWEPIINKTTDLFLRTDTDQAEITASVLFAEKELNAAGRDVSERDVLRTVMEWKSRRRPPLDESEVAEAVRNLGVLDWIHVKPTPDLVPEYA